MSSRLRDLNFRNALLLTLLMVLAPMLGFADHDEYDVDDDSSILKGKDVISYNLGTPLSVGNFSTGGYHIVTNEWWEPVTPYIPTPDDVDGDGVNNSEDDHPFNRNLPSLGVEEQDCSSICVAESIFSLSDNGVIPEFTDSYQSYSSIRDAALGDLDRDGDLDLVFIHSNWVEYSENVNGVFKDPMVDQRYLSTNGNFNIGSARSIDLVDFNMDGYLDMVIGGYTGVGLLEMTGFTPKSTNSIITASNNDGGNYWMQTDFGDVNGDGCPEILLTAAEPDYIEGKRIRLLGNSCSGGSTTIQEVWNVSVSYAMAGILADINGDGFDDVVQVSLLGSDSDYYPDILIHPSDGSIPSEEPTSDWAFSDTYIGDIRDLESGDFNNDGYTDLVVAADYKSFVLHHDGSSGFDVYPEDRTDTTYTTTLCQQSLPVCGEKLHMDSVVDFNQDGLKDILIGENIQLNLGSIGGVSNIFGKIWESDGTSMRVGDLSGNGVLDILSITHQAPMAFFHNGGSIPSKESSNSLISPGIEESETIGYGGLVEDLEGDGDQDIFTLSNSYVGIHLNDGIGGFSANPDLTLSTPWGTSSLAIGDIDDDGAKDLIVNAFGGLKAYWGDENEGFNVSNNANNTYIHVKDTGEDTYFRHVIAEDFDYDGELEIIANVEWTDNTSIGLRTVVYEYDPSTESFDLTWGSVEATSQWTGQKLLIEDVDGNGFKELVRCLSGSIEIYNRSGNTFVASPWVINTGGRGCTFFDVNLDGEMDLLIRSGTFIKAYLGPSFTYEALSKSVYASTHFELNDIDLDGIVELVVGTTQQKQMRIFNVDTTGITGLLWEGGEYRNTQNFAIEDLNGDGSPDMVQMNYQQPWEIIFSIQDTDYDAIPDEEDAYSLDPTQFEDSDDDSFGDNERGFQPDDCPYYWGDSVEDRNGCPDQDGDGWSDLGDDFWREPTQWLDSDGDGLGDNHDGSDTRLVHWPGEVVTDAVNGDPSPLDFDNDGFEDEGLSPIGVDDCPKEMGWSFQDRFGCQDTDWDGWSNNDEDWIQGDKFPNDFTQHSDADGDGFGDNINGTQGDSCPEAAGTSFRDVFGCLDDDRDGWSIYSDFDDSDASKWGVDSDGDGVSDENDRFPDDASQSQDKDGDGYGDNSQGELGDDCPNTKGTSWEDRTGCLDTDDDGFSDQGDQCPNIPGWSDAPWAGCPDSDGDGVADIIDEFPEDVNESRDTDGDGIGDVADLHPRDRDNDGYVDEELAENGEEWDEFPDDEGEWVDSDKDGTGDNGDVWPDNPEIWSDSDGDGWADQFGHVLTDDCPSLPGSSSMFMMGCSDLDEDGMPDILDPDIDGDGITNDNEMDASTKTLIFDPFDASSSPPDIDGDFIPDVLDKDRDGDGFPDELEKERGSDYKDGNLTPFNQYGDQDTGLFYVPGEGFKSQYDPEGMEISVSMLINLITSELLLPIAMFPLAVFALLRKRRRYKKIRRKLEDCKDIDVLKAYEEDIDHVIINRKVKVEHGMLLRNMFERLRDEFEDKEQVRLLGGKAPTGTGGGGNRPGGPGGGLQRPGGARPTPGRGRY